MSTNKHTGRSLNAINKALELGEPIAEFLIYENDHDLISEKIKKHRPKTIIIFGGPNYPLEESKQKKSNSHAL